MKDSWKQVCLWAGLMLAITVVTYLPALRDGFVWDDLQNIIDNQPLRNLDGLKQIWINPHASYQYYPLTYASFWVDYHLWGLHPFGYHLVNILLHALNALLLGLVLRRLLVPGAWLAALIFAVHPVHVESVAWVTERKNVLSGVFFLASFLAYLHFTTGTKRRGRWYALSLGLFLCALLGKTATAILPVVILLVLWWKQDRLRRADVLLAVPFFLISAALGLVTVWVEVHDVGAQGPEWAMPLAQRVLMAGRAVWFYAGKLVWPDPLIFIYPKWQLDPAAWRPWLFPAAALAVIGLLWFSRRRIGKGPLVAALIFICATAPVPAFIKLYFMHYSYAADHFQYLASMSLIALAAAGIARGLRPAVPRAAVAGAILAVLGVLSWRHCGVLRDNESLWRDTIARNPDCWMAHNNLASILFDRGNMPEAIAEYDQAVRIDPDLPDTYYNLGLAYSRLGRIPEAISECEQAVRLKPDYAEAHNELGILLLQAGQLGDAIGHFEEAVRLKPNYWYGLDNLGGALLQAGRIDEAIGQYEEALRIKPDFAEAHNNLGLALARTGRIGEAIGHYEEAVRLNPLFVEAHYNLGLALERAGRPREAIAHYEQALRLKPDFADAQSALARLRPIQ